MRIIAGEYGGRVLKTAQGPGYRPAMGKVREALFSMLESRGVVWSGLRVLDLYAGSGSLAFEALSRGASEAWFVEAASGAAECIRSNAQALAIAPERWRVVREDCNKLLARRARAAFDMVFVDPPYGEGRLSPTLRNVVCNGWLADGAIVAVELEARLPLDPERENAALALMADRIYGQTRIVLWTTRGNGQGGLPYTPAPSTP